jgi:translation initiation factor 5
LEEKALLEWGEKASKKYVSKEVSQQIRDKAKPFLKWLQEAEEESEEESDDDLEIEYDDRVRNDTLKTQVAKPASSKKVVDDDEGDDVDIDAI